MASAGEAPLRGVMRLWLQRSPSRRCGLESCCPLSGAAHWALISGRGAQERVKGRGASPPPPLPTHPPPPAIAARTSCDSSFPGFLPPCAERGRRSGGRAGHDPCPGSLGGPPSSVAPALGPPRCCRRCCHSVTMRPGRRAASEATVWPGQVARLGYLLACLPASRPQGRRGRPRLPRGRVWAEMLRSRGGSCPPPGRKAPLPSALSARCPTCISLLFLAFGREKKKAVIPFWGVLHPVPIGRRAREGPFSFLLLHRVLLWPA